MADQWIKWTGGGKTIAFNKTANGAKSFADFAEHEKHHGLTTEQLREIHQLCGGKAKKPKPPESPASDSGAQGEN